MRRTWAPTRRGNGRAFSLSALLVMVGLLGACATSGAASDDDTAVTEQKEKKSTAPKSLAEIQGTSDVELMYWAWSRSGDLIVGYADGVVGVAAVAKKEIKQFHVGEDVKLRGVSPDGRLAWVDDGNRTKIVGLGDNPKSLTMNEVGHLVQVAFSPDGATLYGAEADGQLHIWEGLGDRLHSPEKTLEEVVRRQLPDFTAHVGVASPILIGSRGELVFGDSTGRLTRWHPDEPESILRLASLDQPIARVGEGNDFYVAMLGDGSIAVVDFEYGVVDWSQGTKAQWATSSPVWHRRAALVADGKFSVVDSKTGEEQWQTAMPRAETCGVSLSQDARSLAICVGGKIAVVNRDDGKLLHVLSRSDDKLRLE
ncbi:MAG: WD40 repeat domain-containing protein [Bradymonadaceae bacterium]